MGGPKWTTLSSEIMNSFDITDDAIGLESFTVRIGTSGPLSWVTITDDDSTLILYVRSGGVALY